MFKHLTEERKAISNNKDSPATWTIIFLAFINSISIILFRLLVWDTVSETLQSFLLIHPFTILFSLVKCFIRWPVEDFTQLSRIFLSQGRKMSRNNLEEGLPPDFTTGLVISFCVLKNAAGLREMGKLYKKTHISNRSPENWMAFMWEETLHLGRLTLAMYLGFISSLFLQDRITVHSYLQHQILFPKWPCWW